MSIKKVWAAFFSPTGNCEKIAVCFARAFAEAAGAQLLVRDFTLPEAREEVLYLDEDDYLVIVMPVYAGRIPNKMLPWLKAGFRGSGTRATAIVSYGNRNPDSALGELKMELENNGFKVVSAAAAVSEHAFSDVLAGGRPDEDDMERMRKFAVESFGVMQRGDSVDIGERARVEEYYVPKRTDGEPARFLKAKPAVSRELCTSCGKCADVCPMGSISHDDTSVTEGICIKCQACIHKCPVKARHFDDEDFLSHRQMLIENFAGRKESEYYI